MANDMNTNPNSADMPPANQAPPATEPAPNTEVQAPVDPPKQKTGRSAWKLALVLIVLLLIAAGVGYYFNNSSNNKNQNTASNNPNIAHLSLAIANTDFGNTIYPNNPSDTAGAQLINAQIFDGLVGYRDQNKLVPDLATGWSNPDENSWLFSIKKGVKFHDGNTLVPADVKYSLDLMRTSDSQYAQTFASTIKSVDLIGNDQVKVTTSQPDPVLLNKLAYLYVVDHAAPKNSDPTAAGTGAYYLKPGTTPSNTGINLVAFNNYHLGPVYTKSLSLNEVKTEQDALNGLKNHTYNIVGEITPAKSNVTNTTKFTEDDSSVDFLAFNTTSGPLSNKSLREAIRYAVNPTKVGQAAGRVVTPLSQAIPPAIPGYNPAIPAYKQNLTKAKQLLTQAGYPNGVTLTMSTNDYSQQPNEIVAELKQAGINVQLNQQPDFDTFLNDFLDGKGQVYFLAYGSDTLDGADILSSIIPPTNYSNDQFNSLISQAASTVDPAKRLKLLQQAETTIDTDVAIVPLSTTNHIYLMDHPYAIHQDLSGAYISAFFYKVHK